MNAPPDLNAALRACARGIYATEASVELLISHGTFLRRNDFRHGPRRRGTAVLRR
jgi:hypothetical protein